MEAFLGDVEGGILLGLDELCRNPLTIDNDASGVSRETASLPSWWLPSGYRSDAGQFGILEDGFLRQSGEEAKRWAEARVLTPSGLVLSTEDCCIISLYSNGEAHRVINENYYGRHETPENVRLRQALRRGVIPDGVVVWRGAGFRLFQYPLSGLPVSKRDLRQAAGRVFEHRAPISTSVGNYAAEKGQGQEVQYRLHVEPGVRGIFIPEIAVKGYAEMELLLAPETPIRIELVEECGSKWFVLATVLAQG